MSSFTLRHPTSNEYETLKSNQNTFIKDTHVSIDSQCHSRFDLLLLITTAAEDNEEDNAKEKETESYLSRILRRYNLNDVSFSSASHLLDSIFAAVYSSASSNNTSQLPTGNIFTSNPSIQIIRNTFTGKNILPLSLSLSKSKSKSTTLISNNTQITNSILEPPYKQNLVITNNGALHNLHSRSSTISNNGSIGLTHPSTNKDERFAFNLKINVGSETGGERPVYFSNPLQYGGIPYAMQQLNVYPFVYPKPSKHEDFVHPTAVLFNVVTCDNSQIISVNDLTDAYLSANATLRSVLSPSNNVFLNSNSSCTGATSLTSVILESNSEVTTGSIVSDVMLMESSSITQNATCVSSIIGPDSHLSNGETHHSLLGPLSNAHHQSLLIAIIAPLGRGNVGYGANVGSNHTGRTADQECVLGEGVFLGLSVVVKFPIDLSYAPYTLIAAGVNFNPQRMCFPFCLVSTGDTKFSSEGLNLLQPGWVCSDSNYTLARSETKFMNRRKAKRHGWYAGYKILRPTVVNMCVCARMRLVKVKGKAVYTDKDIDGLGKNYITEQGRINGIVSYTNVILRYALLGLLEVLERDGFTTIPSNCESGDLNVEDWKDTSRCLTLSWDEDGDESSVNLHQMKCIGYLYPEVKGEVLSFDDCGDFLNLLNGVCTKYAESVMTSKTKDDYRGSKTTTFYDNVHVKAKDDSVVVDCFEQVKKIKGRVERVKVKGGGGGEGGVSKL